jgi:hypothetical protein
MLLMSLIDSYQQLVLQAPFLTNCIAGGSIAAIGDLLCQRYFEYPKLLRMKKQQVNFEYIGADNVLETFQIDYKLDEIEDGEGRVELKSSSRDNQQQTDVDQELQKQHPFHWNVKRTIEMALIRAVVVTPYVVVWYKFLAELFAHQSILGLITRITLDQLLSSPFMIVVVFFAHMIIRRYPWHHFISQLRNEFLPAWKAGLQYWPFVHLITYGVLPLVYQPLFAHFASVYWNGVLSYYANLAKLKEAHSQ